ncbi:transcription antitermination factor NusB [Ohessyouella blattaphilus]|uniref:Transcription antitermination protein NusB n=1 Tax=Ohessyouella blattaphilus TaxID=2949333 RepID=A0ABT1EN68_9FIRM|nr:transcription antitermination factor NusB [Ohessyouella blattaphilus]MCP1111222.1 transcription antitermination factor NusB [Ohessyouella blattaphilus]MCR8564616.1 transcription antitermination factor NusB [Ohessyouella blattaphilus]
MTRKEQREHVFKLVFELEFHSNGEIPEQQQEYFSSLGEVEPQETESIQKKASAVADHATAIDELLNTKTAGWKTSRMNKVDLAILRLAVYEMLYDEEVPEKVAINEAVELAKKYSGGDGPAFINGVLAKFTQERE